MTLLELTILAIKEKKTALDLGDEAFVDEKTKGNDEYEERVDNELAHENYGS